MAEQIKQVDFSPEIQKWRSAGCGEEVRGAGISSLEKMQVTVNETVVSVNKAADNAEQAVGNANKAIEDANEAIETANSAVLEAATSAQEAKDSSTLSQSWTEGGTGVREGENTNNAKFWSGQSQNEADRARNEADRAAQYAQIIAPNFFLDVEDGWLYQKGGAGVEFAVGEDGALYWKIVA